MYFRRIVDFDLVLDEGGVESWWQALENVFMNGRVEFCKSR